MRVSLSCPICSRRITDTEDTVKTEMIVISPKQKATCLADYYVKCWGCKNEVGLRKII